MKKQLTIVNRISDLEYVRDMVYGFGPAFGFDARELDRLNLVMEEAVSNVMLYAFPEGEIHDIEICVDWDEKEGFLAIVISDGGKEFDPTAKKDADITLCLEERQIGGLGIFLVKSIMDSVEYERREGKNILTLKKKMDINNKNQ